MYKPTHTENDYTAEYLGSRLHSGSKTCRVVKKRSSEKRGRKSKAGRTVRSFKITLMPSRLQAVYLNMDLQFFNEMYAYASQRLSEAHLQDSKGFYQGYDVLRERKTALFRKRKTVVPHTPKYIMNSQNELISENTWMRGCTYQVSYRATVNAFKDAVRPVSQKEFSIGGNTFEAKLCYRVVNGYLYLKKFDQLIPIKETLPKGGLESIRITKTGEEWTAIIEILEQYDKAEDIRESKKGVLQTDVEKRGLHTTYEAELLLEKKAALFNNIANVVIKEGYRKSSLHDKLRCYQNVYGAGEEDLGLINMACVAANARAYKYRKQEKPPKISKKYIALSEGFYIKDRTLHLTRWGISIPVSQTSKLEGKWFDYIVIEKTSPGIWTVSGKRQKRKIFRNLSRLFIDFSWKDNMIFKN